MFLGKTAAATHPAAASLHVEVLLPDDDSTTPIHPVIFDVLDGPFIKAAALRISRPVGPSSTDAHGWRRLCSSFHSALDELTFFHCFITQPFIYHIC